MFRSWERADVQIPGAPKPDPIQRHADLGVRYVATLPSALFVERLSLGASWVFLIQ